MKRFLMAGVLGAAMIATTQTAQADAIFGMPGYHNQRTEFELHGILNPVGCGWNECWGGAWGVGARLNIPLLRNGPIPTVNNSFALGLGADMLVYSWGDRWSRGFVGAVEPVFSANLQWNFYFFGAFSMFVEGGVAAGFGECDQVCSAWLWPGLAIGGRIHFSGRADYPALTFRFGFPTGFNLGISF